MVPRVVPDGLTHSGDISGAEMPASCLALTLMSPSIQVHGWQGDRRLTLPTCTPTQVEAHGSRETGGGAERERPALSAQCQGGNRTESHSLSDRLGVWLL